MSTPEVSAASVRGVLRPTVGTWSALVGLVFAVPLAVLNAIVAQRVEPVFSWIRPGEHTGPWEYPLLVMALLLLPAGALITMSPLMRVATDGQRIFPVANAVVAVLLLSGL